MRIYSRKKMLFGLFCLALGLVNFILGLTSQNLDFSDIILILALLFFGCNDIRHSLSANLSREDKLEDWDERNRLIDLKSRSKCCLISQNIFFFAMLILMVAGKINGETTLIAVGAGFGLAWTISIFTELAANFYYQSHI